MGRDRGGRSAVTRFLARCASSGRWPVWCCFAVLNRGVGHPALQGSAAQAGQARRRCAWLLAVRLRNGCRKGILLVSPARRAGPTGIGGRQKASTRDVASRFRLGTGFVPLVQGRLALEGLEVARDRQWPFGAASRAIGSAAIGRRGLGPHRRAHSGSRSPTGPCRAHFQRRALAAVRRRHCSPRSGPSGAG